MTQEDKELLLKDLCVRLPYGVIVKLDNKFKFNKGDRVLVKELLDLYCIEGIKPYLRPISSMTEEEGKEYRMFIDYSYNDFTSESTPCVYVDKINDYIDWLLQHHFDFRGLVEKGLALEAPVDMYK